MSTKAQNRMLYAPNLPPFFKLECGEEVCIYNVPFRVQGVLHLFQRKPVSREIDEYRSLLLYRLKAKGMTAYLFCEAERTPVFTLMSGYKGRFTPSESHTQPSTIKGCEFWLYNHGRYEVALRGSLPFTPYYYAFVWLYKAKGRLFAHIWQNGKAHSFVGTGVPVSSISFKLHHSRLLS